MNDLADKILSYRAKENMSQKDFAEKCNLTVQTICNIERGIQKPSRLTERKILIAIEEE